MLARTPGWRLATLSTSGSSATRRVTSANAVSTVHASGTPGTPEEPSGSLTVGDPRSTVRRSQPSPRPARRLAYPPSGRSSGSGADRSSSLPQTLQATSVEVERDAGDVAGALRAEKRNGVGQLLGAPEAPERVLAGGQAARLVLGACAQLRRQAGGVATPHAGVDPAGADGVDEDVVGAQLGRKHLGQVEKGAVGDAAAQHVGI